jgi:hypothetical protein
MNALPPTVQTSLGRTLHLTKQIGKGGEGAIYETREQNDIAVKLYWPNKALSRRESSSWLYVWRRGRKMGTAIKTSPA